MCSHGSLSVVEEVGIETEGSIGASVVMKSSNCGYKNKKINKLWQHFAPCVQNIPKEVFRQG
jgi:hypothetical protein